MLRLFTCGYSDQLLTYQLEQATGKLTSTGGTRVSVNATFAALGDHNDVFIVHEVSNFENKFQNSGGISRWKFDDSGIFTNTTDTVPSWGQGPCHISIMKELSLVLVSNYHGFAFTAYTISKETGNLRDLSFDDQFKDMGSNAYAGRQETSHPHGAYFYKNNVYVCDLGSDKIWHYSVTSTTTQQRPKFTKLECIQLPLGCGPRHMAVDESNKRAFLVTELSAQIFIFDICPDTGLLSHSFTHDIYSQDFLNELGSSPREDQYPSEIVLHPMKDILYVSNRGRGAIFVYDVSNGGFQARQTIFLEGGNPRHFTISPDLKFMVIGQKADNILEVYKLDLQTGELTEKTDSLESINSPAFVSFY